MPDAILYTIAACIFAVTLWLLLVGGYDYVRGEVLVQIEHMDYDAHPFVASITVGVFWTIASFLVFIANPELVCKVIETIPFIGKALIKMNVFSDVRTLAIYDTVFNTMLAFCIRKLARAQTTSDVDLPAHTIDAWEDKQAESEGEESAR